MKNPAEVRLLARQLIEGTRNEVKRLQRNPPNLKAPSTSNVKDLFPKETIEIPAMSHQVYDRKVNLRLKNLVVLTGPWNPLSNAAFVSSLHKAFPKHNIVTHHLNAIYHHQYSVAAEIDELTRADILIGFHTSSLTKIMFMPPNSVLFEIAPQLNDAQMPLCGYYGNMAYLTGSHHYLYTYDKEGDFTNETLNLDDVVLRVHSF